MDPSADWESLVHGLRDGDAKAARVFWGRYGQALERLAANHIGRGLRHRIGADDVVQSACRSFLRRAKKGEFQLPDAESLWQLLCAITLTKIREQVRFHTRQKRGVHREVSLETGGSESEGGHSPIDPQPTPAEAVAFAEALQVAIRSLEEEEQQIVGLKLQDRTNTEIADLIGSSERTVRRILRRVQSRLRQTIEP